MRNFLLLLYADDAIYSDNLEGGPSASHNKLFAKGINNGCPYIMEIKDTQGRASVGDPARAVGECMDVANAQP